MSNLSELLPSGGGQNVVEFTASGAVASGKPVILNSNGTVTEVAATAQEVGSEQTFAAQRSDYKAIAYDSNANKVLVLYYNQGFNTSYGIVGTVSGTSISWGTQTSFASGPIYDMTNAVFDSANNKVIFAYRTGTSNGLRAVVATISGTSVSFGSYTAVETGSTENGASLAYDTNSGKVVVAYPAANNSQYGTAVVGTISGTSISFGSPVVYDSNNVAAVNQVALYDPTAQKTIIAWRDGSATKANAIVGTVSGTSISFGSAAVIDSTIQPQMMMATYDTDQNKLVIGWRDTSNNGYANVCTVSGTSITAATTQTIISADIFGSTNNRGIFQYDPDRRTITCYYIDTSYTISTTVFSVSGNSVTVGASTVIDSTGSGAFLAATYDTSADKNIFIYGDGYAAGRARTFTSASTNLTAASFIGLASAAISDTATGNINVKGGINEVASPALATGSETNLTGKTQSPYPVITYDITNSKFVVFFQDGNNSNYGTSVVVTVSGTTVTFGTPVVFNSGSTNYIDATYSESNGKHLVVYPDYGNSQQATAIVGTVSGTSISFGSEQVYDTGTVNTRVSVAYNSNLDKYLAGSTPSSGTINVTVLTVSGTTVSAGTPVSLSGTKYLPNIASNESASDFVLGNNKNDNQSEAHLISVSGTVPTVEASTDLSAVVSSSFPRTGLAFLESNKFVCVYSDNSTNSMYTRTITVSGTSLSLGTASSAFTVDPNPQTNINGAWPLFKATTTSAYLYYQDDTSNYLKYVPISISGTTATSGTEVTYTSQTSDYEGFLYSADAKQGLSFFQSTDSGQQTAAIAQSGVFAIGSDYYVQTDGTLATTADTPSVKVGQAISATTINMMDLT